MEKTDQELRNIQDRCRRRAICPKTPDATSISKDVAKIAPPKDGKFVAPAYKPEPCKHGDIPSRYRGWTLDDFPNAQPFIRAWMGDKGKWALYLYGALGSHKSSLAAAALKEWRTHYLPPWDGPHAGFYAPVDWLVPRLRDPEQTKWVMNRCQTTKLLVLDDIGGNRSTAHVLEQVGFILRHRYDNHSKVIITSNLSLQAFATEVDERIADRLREGQRMLCGKTSKRHDDSERQQDNEK